MRILFIGDIVGSPGRQIVHDRLADTVAQQRIDLVIANCENAASGFGITPRLAQELLEAGIAVLTGGNHIYDRREILEFFPHEPRLLRPANFPAANPGSGLYLGSVTPRFCSGDLQVGHARGTAGSAPSAFTLSSVRRTDEGTASAATPTDAPVSVWTPATAFPGARSSGASFLAEQASDSSSGADQASDAGPAKPPSFGADSSAPAVGSLYPEGRAPDGRAAPSTQHLTPVKFAVLNLQGRVFMAPNDCPFKTVDRELARIPSDVKIILVDMHAEATSEKVAMGWYLDGRVTAVIGTHTHVASADERVLPGGTAVITDVGFTGPHNGIIGMAKDAILGKFLDGLPTRFSVADSDVRMNCALINVDLSSGKAASISRLCLKVD